MQLIIYNIFEESYNMLKTYLQFLSGCNLCILPSIFYIYIYIYIYENLAGEKIDADPAI
jgi:hypothetical protein